MAAKIVQDDVTKILHEKDGVPRILDALKRHSQRQDEKIECLASEINELKQEIEQETKQKDNYMQQVQEEKAKSEALESLRRDLQTARDELEKEKTENAKLLSDTQKNGCEMAALNEKLEWTTNERDESLDSQKVLKETMKKLDETLMKTSTENVRLENALKTEIEDKTRLRGCLDEKTKDFEIKIQQSRNEEKILLQKCEKQNNDISALKKDLDDAKVEKEKLSKELCLTKELQDATVLKLQALQKESEEGKRDAEARMQCKIADLEYRNAELDDSLSREQARVKKKDETLSTAEKSVRECIQLSEQGIKERKERKEVLRKIKEKMELYTKRAYADQAGSSSKRLSLLECPNRKVKTQREIYCDNLRAGWTAMIPDLDNLLDTESNVLLDSLFQYRVIESAEYNKIRSLTKRTGERSREFLLLLMGKKVDSITKFIELLKEDDHARHLADIVEGYSAFSSGSPSSEDLAFSGSDSDVSTERKAVQVSEPMS